MKGKKVSGIERAIPLGDKSRFGGVPVDIGGGGSYPGARLHAMLGPPRASGA
jgi:hypothetical protein